MNKTHGLNNYHHTINLEVLSICMTKTVVRSFVVNEALLCVY